MRVFFKGGAMGSIIRTAVISIFLISIIIPATWAAEPLIIDHTCTDVTKIPQTAIEQAKHRLHIAYGHAVHGSQLTSGMTGLVAFANGGGLGLALPEDIFAWNDGGTDGALDLHDNAMGGSMADFPQWVRNTRSYLDNPLNEDVNVVVWSWCDQMESKYAAGTIKSEYLKPMAQLEADYPHVTFVYMTGHVNIWNDANNKTANQIIRDYCRANNKVLYDFADIERYDPNGTYYEFAHENCDYYDTPGGKNLGNWATLWQDNHDEGVDWYYCYTANTESLNANQKAYAAWWLWARLVGWDGVSDSSTQPVLDASIPVMILALIGILIPGVRKRIRH
jgi:hypothetical protein